MSCVSIIILNIILQRDVNTEIARRRTCPDCNKDYNCSARQLMRHMMTMHPVANQKLAESKAGKLVMKRSLKRAYVSPLTNGAKRQAKDSGVTNTPSTSSPRGDPPRFPSRDISFELAQAANLSVGLETGFLFRIYNTFRGQPRAKVIKILKSGYLQLQDLSMLVAEAEDREVKVSELIEAIVKSYIFD